MIRALACAAAFFLFACQPLAGKWLLPAFGGAPAVWIACLLVFQLAVILGYGSVSFVLRLAPPRRRVALVTLTVLAVSLIVGRGHPAVNTDWGHPALTVIISLSTWIVPAAVLLAITSPLLQHERHRRGDQDPYRLSAWSNVGSLLGLLSYPVLIEPWLTRTQQTFIFAAGVAVIGSALTWSARMPAVTRVATAGRRLARWWIFPALGTVLLAGHTQVLSQEIAPIPLLWVLPLALYLITWIVPFAHPRGYHRGAAISLAALAMVGRTALLWYIPVPGPGLAITLELIVLGLGCWCCHGEVARLRPPPAQLEQFWLITALGGAAGTCVVVIGAPLLLVSTVEHRIAIAVVLAIAALSPRLNATRHAGRYGLVGVLILVVGLAAQSVGTLRDGYVYAQRSFFGVLRVRDIADGQAARRLLYHGGTAHGIEMTEAITPPRPAAYYGETSGVGAAFQYFRDQKNRPPLRVAAVGLGIGTVASWLRPGDHLTFVEIDPAVTAIAHTYFRFLAESPGTIAVQHGDGRLVLAQAAGPYDLIILDAFSDGAVPAHLLTAEAFAIWQRLLAPGGLCCVHISNRYLDLEPVVRAAADSCGWQHLIIDDAPPPAAQPRCLDSIWLLAGDPTTIAGLPAALRTRASADPGLRRLWTDERSDLWAILRSNADP